MDKQRQQAMESAREFVVYQESEQADLDTSDNKFDAMWQSIYDVCKLVHFGIIDDITQDEFDEAYKWLLATQSLTDDYQNYNIEF